VRLPFQQEAATTAEAPYFPCRFQIRNPIMKLHTAILLSAVLLAIRPAATAGDRNPFGNGELPEILKPFDVDGDGKLSTEERQAFVAAVRAGEVPRPNHPDHPDNPGGNPWDTDGDGKLSDEEKAAAQESIRARILEQRGRRFDEMDTDDDGFLTLEELGGIPGVPPNGAARILAHLDTDDDGKVSKEEFLGAIRPPRPHGPPQAGDPPPPPTAGPP
jgi:Ca2+-binding EF-hand superfamily protein